MYECKIKKKKEIVEWILLLGLNIKIRDKISLIFFLKFCYNIPILQLLSSLFILFPVFFSVERRMNFLNAASSMKPAHCTIKEIFINTNETTKSSKKLRKLPWMMTATKK